MINVKYVEVDGETYFILKNKYRKLYQQENFLKSDLKYYVNKDLLE